jgi:Na+-transporting NADH:ubiquinone oxidoreductase subunit C
VHSNSYTFLYAIGISILTAVILAFAAEGLKPMQDANIKLDNKTSILRAVKIYSTDRKELETTYDTKVREIVVNAAGEEITGEKASAIKLKEQFEKPEAERHLPLFVFTGPDNRERYVVPMQGVGLWGPIYGYISLEDDLNTVYGAFFAHKGETPGLGAEIAERFFQDQFPGKKIMDASNNFVSVNVVKTSAKVDFGPEHRVDGISGGTITSDGTDKMIEDCFKPYLAYFVKIRQAS